MIQTIRRAVEGATEVNRKTRTIRAVINDDSVDRYGTVIDPAGIDTSNYMAAGGPVLTEHGKGQHGPEQIGNATAIERGKLKGRSVLVADVKFWESGPTELPEKLWRRYSAREMRSWSVNVRALDHSPPTPSEIRSRPDLADCSTIFRRTEMLELSAVSCGGNANALTVEVHRGLELPAGLALRFVVERFGAWLGIVDTAEGRRIVFHTRDREEAKSRAIGLNVAHLKREAQWARHDAMARGGTR